MSCSINLSKSMLDSCYYDFIFLTFFLRVHGGVILKNRYYMWTVTVYYLVIYINAHVWSVGHVEASVMEANKKILQ